MFLTICCDPRDSALWPEVTVLWLCVGFTGYYGILFAASCRPCAGKKHRLLCWVYPTCGGDVEGWYLLSQGIVIIGWEFQKGYTHYALDPQGTPLLELGTGLVPSEKQLPAEAPFRYLPGPPWPSVESQILGFHAGGITALPGFQARLPVNL